jgi:hypothetical protein
MVDYICYRCFYKTTRKSNINAHFSRLNNCVKSDKCYYSNEEINRLNLEQFNKKKLYTHFKTIRRITSLPSFNNEVWTISHISEINKYLLLFSPIMFSKLLEYILNNNVNHNVIVDVNYGIGMVINGNKEVYKRIHDMEIEEISNKTLDKLQQILIGIYEEFEPKYKDLCFGDIKNNIIKAREENCINDNIIKIYDRYYNNIIESIKKIGI